MYYLFKNCIHRKSIHPSSNTKARTVSCLHSLYHVRSGLFQNVTLNKARGKHSSNSNKADRAAFRILSGLTRTTGLQQRQCQRSGPLTANTYFSQDDIFIGGYCHPLWKKRKKEKETTRLSAAQKNLFPWQRLSPNFQVLSVTEADIRWAIITFSPILHLASAAFSLVCLLLSCLVLLLPLSFLSSFVSSSLSFYISFFF